MAYIEPKEYFVDKYGNKKPSTMERRPLEFKKHTIIRTMDCKNCFTKHGDILQELCDPDWAEAFHYADFEREDVEEVIHMVDGCNDEDPWVALFKLKNGKYAGLNAWCDYTGWD